MVDQYNSVRSLAAASSPPIDHHFLEEMTGGDSDFVRELLQEFLNTVPPLMQQIRAAIDAGDSTTLAQAAHTLKGSARSVGAHRLAEAAQVVERAAREHHLETAAEAAQTLAAEWQHVSHHIHQFLLRAA